MPSDLSMSGTLNLGSPDNNDGLPEIPGLDQALQAANEASALTDDELSDLLRTAFFGTILQMDLRISLLAA